MSGTERLAARALVREAIDRVLAEWSGLGIARGTDASVMKLMAHPKGQTV